MEFLPRQTIKLSDATNGITLLERDQNGLTLRVSVGSLDVDPVDTKAGTFTLLPRQNFDHSRDDRGTKSPVANQLIGHSTWLRTVGRSYFQRDQEVSLSDFGENDRLMPVQPSLSKSQNPADVPFEFKQEVYQRAGYYQLPAAVDR